MEKYEFTPVARIKVIGIGGAGNNALNRMIDANITGVEFIAMNTDKQALRMSKAGSQLALGEKLTRGLGAGSNPEIGQRAAEESRSEIEALIKDSDLIFITAGMGGGTGTGAAPVVAQIARELGILTIAVVTKPFDFEGAHRRLNSEIGINNLGKFVDTTIIVPNQKLIENTHEKTSMIKAFEIADEVLRQGILGITDLILTPMYINLDFADIDAVMRNSGIAHMGVGRAKGEGRLLTAIRQAVSSPMLETSIHGASKIIMSIHGGMDLDIHEVSNSGNLIREVVDPGCNIIFGAHIDMELNDEVQIIIIATGFPKRDQMKQPAEGFARPSTNNFGYLSKFNTEPGHDGAPQIEAVSQFKPMTAHTTAPVAPAVSEDDGIPPYIKRLRGKK